MNKSIKCLGAKVLKSAGIIRRYIAQQKSVRILMYHRVNDDQDCLGLTVRPELFAHQLQYLKDNYEVITLAEAVSHIASGSISNNYCVITFDDGYRDNYQIAAPLLAEYGVPATIFVTCDAVETGQFGWGAFDRTLLTTKVGQIDLNRWGVGQYELINQAAREQAVITLHRLLKKLPDAVKQEIVAHVVATYGDGTGGQRTMMTWAEVAELAAGSLVTIGAHTVSHPILSRMPEAQARYEICEGKRTLEGKISRTVNFFAYPNGRREDIGPNIVALVKQAGFHAACTTIPGQNATGADPFELRRIDVTNSMSTDARSRFSPDLFAFSLSGLFQRC